MNVKLIAAISFFFLLSTTSFAQDDSEYLSVRQLPNSESYEAVLSLDSTVCVQVNPETSVTVVGSEVTIESPWIEQFPCIFIPPVVYYEITAYIGYLAPGKYTVTWSQPEAFSWSTLAVISETGAIPVNALWALLLLTLGVLAVAHFTPYLRSRSGPK